MTDKPPRKKQRKKPERGRTNRPLQYTEAIGIKVCEAIALGEPLKEICKADPTLPSEQSIRRWVLDPEHPMTPKYQLAREMHFHRMADELIEIADDTRNDFLANRNAEGKKLVDEKAINRSRLMVDTRKWLLAKVLPRTYGDKVEIGGKDGGPIQFEHQGMTDLEAARRMVLMLFEQVSATGGNEREVMKLLNGSVVNDEAKSS